MSPGSIALREEIALTVFAVVWAISLRWLLRKRPPPKFPIRKVGLYEQSKNFKRR